MGHFMVNLFNLVRTRLFYKMLIIYSLLMLVPLIIVSATFYFRSSQLIGKKAMEEAQQGLAAAASAIDAPLSAIKKRMLEIGKRDVMESYLKLYNQTDANATSDSNRQQLLDNTIDALQVELAELKRSVGEFVDNLYVVTLDDQVFGTDGNHRLQYPSAYRLLPFEFDRMPEWAFFSDDKRMGCDMKIYESGTDEVLGWLVVTLAPASLQQTFVDFASGTFYITNSDNIILSASHLDEIGRVLDVRGPDTLLLIQQKSQYADFLYIRLASPRTGGIVEKQAKFAAWVTFVAWLTVFFVTYYILKRVTAPIQRLTRLMRRAEREEYQLVQDVSTRDEIAMLCHGYNEMVRRTKDLIDKNYKNELLVREAELKAIRMYINPHFLYNTLEYISIMSQKPEKAKFVPDIVQSLSSIFRFSIVPGEKFVSLETEMAFAGKYLQIHQYRLGERLQYRTALPQMLRQSAVPKLILQPLVENAVIHGIDRLQGGGRIEIEAREEDYKLVIEIRNSVPPEKAEGSLSSRQSARKGLGSGLENVNARVRHHFGNVYGVKLSREDENSVTVTLQMPIQLWSETGED